MTTFVLRWLTFAVCGVAAFAANAPQASSTPSQPAQPARCPVETPRDIPANSWAQARRQLAPKGASALRLCRYAGLDQRPASTLRRSRLLTGQALSKLVREFNRLPPFPRGVIACPMDDGSQIIALLAYRSGRRVTIELDMTGCQSVTNGDLVRTADGFGMPPRFGPQLVTELERLTRGCFTREG